MLDSSTPNKDTWAKFRTANELKLSKPQKNYKTWAKFLSDFLLAEFTFICPVFSVSFSPFPSHETMAVIVPFPLHLHHLLRICTQIQLTHFGQCVYAVRATDVLQNYNDRNTDTAHIQITTKINLVVLCLKGNAKKNENKTQFNQMKNEWMDGWAKTRKIDALESPAKPTMKSKIKNTACMHVTRFVVFLDL